MSRKNEKLLENNYLLKIENLKLRKQRNAKCPLEESHHECPDSSVSSICCPTVQRIMQLQKHNMDPKNAYAYPDSSNDNCT